MRGGPARQPGAGNIQSTPPFQQGDGTVAPAVVGAPPAPAIPPGHRAPMSAFGRSEFQQGESQASGVTIAVPLGTATDANPTPTVITLVAELLGQANDADTTPSVLLASGPSVSAGSASGTGPGILLQESPTIGAATGTDPTPADDIAILAATGQALDANPTPTLGQARTPGAGDGPAVGLQWYCPVHELAMPIGEDCPGCVRALLAKLRQRSEDELILLLT